MKSVVASLHNKSLGLVNSFALTSLNLTLREVQELRAAHQRTTEKNHAYKINTILLIGTGWEYQQVAAAMLLDEETLRSYVELYKAGGLENLLKDDFQCGQIIFTSNFSKTQAIPLDRPFNAPKETNINKRKKPGLYAPSITLTKMEAKCLYWAMQGKTAEETAMILDNSKRTVEGHLLSARTKLGCNKTTGAIIRAEKLGYIRNGEVYTTPLYDVE